MGRRRSQRPAGVRGVVGDPEPVRPLGPELELEAAAGLRVALHEEAVLRRSSERDEAVREDRRESPVRQVRAVAIGRGHHRVVVQDLQKGGIGIPHARGRVQPGVVEFGFRTSTRNTAGTGRFALFAIVAMTRNRLPGETESGTPSTVSVTAKPVTCTSFDTVLLRVGVRMPTALAASKIATKIVARGPSLIPFAIVRTSPAPPRQAGRPTGVPSR